MIKLQIKPKEFNIKYQSSYYDIQLMKPKDC